MNEDLTRWNPDEIAFDSITETPVVLPDAVCQTICRQCRATFASDALICPQCSRPVDRRVSTTRPPGVRDVILAMTLGLVTVLLSVPVNLVCTAAYFDRISQPHFTPVIVLCVWNGWFFGVPAIHLLQVWRRNILQGESAHVSYWREYWWIQFVQMLFPAVLLAFGLLMSAVSWLQQLALKSL